MIFQDKSEYNILKLTIFLFSISSIQIFAAEEPEKAEITIPKVIPKEVIDILKLERNQKVDAKKSLTWILDGVRHFYIPIQAGGNEGCQFYEVVSDTNAVRLWDEFTPCQLAGVPKLVDLDLDGNFDIAVKMRVPHTVGSRIWVNYYMGFIFVSTQKGFCKSSEASELVQGIDEAHIKLTNRIFKDITCSPE